MTAPPTLTPSLRATLEQRLADLARAPTISASPGATLRPSSRAVEAWTRPDPSRLPKISIARGDHDAGPGQSADASVADLELGALLGEGGMGRVFAAFQRSLARDVAIKTLRSDTDPGAALSLLREAMIAGSLEHPGIVPVHALGVDAQGAPLLVMKRVEGSTWSDLLRDPAHRAWSSLPADRRLAQIDILRQICRTVEFAHARGVLHRDIKPENVMLGEFGEIYLVDWGIALRLEVAAKPGAAGFAGTPAYMAPEMITGEALDARTDVYLLGASLHEALTGEPRNAGDSIESVLTSALTAAPHVYADDVEPELVALCHRATARQPQDRFASVRELREALDAYLQHRSSNRLCLEATERLRELEQLFAEAPPDAPPADLPRAYRLGAETRFAYVEALAGWPENRLAKEGLARCLGVLVDLELRQGHLETARALLDELGALPPALSEKFAKVERERARKLAEDERLQALAAAQDRSHGGAQRAIALGLYVVVGTSLVAISFWYGTQDFTVERLLYVAVGLLVSSTITTIVLRKGLLGSAFNRRMSGLALAMVVGLCVSRVAALAEHLSVAATVTQDIVALAMMASALTLLELPRMWPAVVVLAGAGVVTVTRPDDAIRAFAVAVAILPLTVLLALRSRERAEQGPEARS